MERLKKSCRNFFVLNLGLNEFPRELKGKVLDDCYKKALQKVGDKIPFLTHRLSKEHELRFLVRLTSFAVLMNTMATNRYSQHPNDDNKYLVDYSLDVMEEADEKVAIAALKGANS